MKTTDKKGILVNLDSESREFLRSLAEKNSSSQSYEVRRLIKNEKKKSENETVHKEIHRGI